MFSFVYPLDLIYEAKDSSRANLVLANVESKSMMPSEYRRGQEKEPVASPA